MSEIISYALTNIVKVILAVIFGAITYYGLPLLKSTVIPWLKEKHLYDVVMKAVQAAEKMAESETISKSEKKNYVINALTNHGISVNNYTESLIESAVKELDDRTAALITDAYEVMSADDVEALTDAETGETSDVEAD